MTERTYMITDRPRGHKGIMITDTTHDTGILHLVEETPPGQAIDVLHAIRRGYSEGREDRSEEILGTAGLDRAARAVARHRPHGILGDTVLGQVVACKCGQFEGRTIAEWQRHLAEAVLQAAGA